MSKAETANYQNFAKQELPSSKAKCPSGYLVVLSGAVCMLMACSDASAALKTNSNTPVGI